MQSGKPCWFRIYYLEYVSLGSLAYVVLHENTSVCTSGLSTRQMQSPVLTLAEYFWEPLPWEGSSARQASKSDLHELSPQDLFLCWDTSSAFLYVCSCYICPPLKKPPTKPNEHKPHRSNSPLWTSVRIAELIQVHSLLQRAGSNRNVRPCLCSFASWSDLCCLHLLLTLASCSVPTQFMKCNWMECYCCSWLRSVAACFQIATKKPVTYISPSLAFPVSSGC